MSGSTEMVDYKKEYRELYVSKATPCVVNVPSIRFVMAKGETNYKKSSIKLKKAADLFDCLCIEQVK